MGREQGFGGATALPGLGEQAVAKEASAPRSWALVLRGVGGGAVQGISCATSQVSQALPGS